VKIVFLVPDPGVPGAFWDVLAAITRSAAERLGVDLEVLSSGKQVERMIDLGKELARRTSRPDCVLLPNYLGAGRELIPVLDAAAIPAFLVTEGLAPSDRLAIGAPRTRHPRWLGELCPDDVAAGHLLAKLLTDRARTLGRFAPDGKIHVGVLAGDQTSAGKSRYQGWLALKKERPEVVQAGVQYAGWDEEAARADTELLLRSHPEVSVVWAANDNMALGAIQAVRAVGKEPGHDVLVGGMDLVLRALERVEQGTMAVTLGGHVLDGARALLLVHDHLAGRDFEPRIRRSSLEAVTAEHARSHLRVFEEKVWRKFDFERYSRAKRADAPELTLAALVDR
jgi:ABC-type sugar transport system substrate-binding protein